MSALGNPDIEIAGLRLWVHSWQFPSATEYWDANWLYCSALCRAGGATARASGAFLHAPELGGWLDQCLTLHATLQGSAMLEPMEPELRVTIKARTLGQMDVAVELSPDPVRQQHVFSFEADQTHIGILISQLKVVLDRFPVRFA